MMLGGAERRKQREELLAKNVAIAKKREVKRRDYAAELAKQRAQNRRVQWANKTAAKLSRGVEMQHFFHGINGWTSEAAMNFYRDVIRDAPDSSTIVEVGVFEGRSASFAGVEIINSGKRIHLYAVDAWSWETKGYGNATKKFYDRLTGEQAHRLTQKHLHPLVSRGVVSLVKSDSVLFAATLDDESIWAVYIDGAHSYEAVKADILAWVPKVKPGGYIGGHDYSPKSWPGVVKAVDECIGRITVEGTVWRARKSERQLELFPGTAPYGEDG